MLQYFAVRTYPGKFVFSMKDSKKRMVFDQRKLKNNFGRARKKNKPRAVSYLLNIFYLFNRLVGLRSHKITVGSNIYNYILGWVDFLFKNDFE
jgi:hypothetical protein